MGKYSAGIDIAAETIGNLLESRNLQVPLSQRSYRWETEHVTELYQDINGAILANEDEYFLGSVVGIKDQGITYIYDGQQRLATIMILIASIRDYFFRKGDAETAILIEGESLVSKHRQTHEVSAHFRLNAEDHAFFHDYILLRPDNESRRKVTPARESHKRISISAKIASEHIKKMTAGLSTQAASDHLHKWLNFIKESLRVIWVQVGDEKTAFTIFETMNDRGLKLSAADLLKNWLYGKGDNRRDEIVQKWQSMIAVLETIEGEEENAVEYIRCYWITQNGHTRTKVLYDEIKKSVTNKIKAVTLASDLESTAQDYAAILLSSHEKLARRGANVRAKIEVIRSLGVTQLRPLLLASFRRFTEKEFDKLLDACVSWSVRSLLSGVPSGTLEGYYSRCALDVTSRKFKTAAQLKLQMASIIPDDSKFENAVANASVANQQLARYYLRALQRCKDGEAEPQYIPNPGGEVTLEHILPSRPGAEWNYISEEDQKKYVNRLGNQVLLAATVNSKIGNAAFKMKKTALAACSFSLTKDVTQYENWGVNEISKRQAELARLAVKTWPLK